MALSLVSFMADIVVTLALESILYCNGRTTCKYRTRAMLRLSQHKSLYADWSPEHFERLHVSSIFPIVIHRRHNEWWLVQQTSTTRHHNVHYCGYWISAHHTVLLRLIAGRMPSQESCVLRKKNCVKTVFFAQVYTLVPLISALHVVARFWDQQNLLWLCL